MEFLKITDRQKYNNSLYALNLLGGKYQKNRQNYAIWEYHPDGKVRRTPLPGGMGYAVRGNPAL